MTILLTGHPMPQAVSHFVAEPARAIRPHVQTHQAGLQEVFPVSIVVTLLNVSVLFLALLFSASAAEASEE